MPNEATEHESRTGVPRIEVTPKMIEAAEKVLEAAGPDDIRVCHRADAIEGKRCTAGTLTVQAVALP